MTTEHKPGEDRTFSHMIWDTESDRFLITLDLTEGEAMALAATWGGLVGSAEEVEDDSGREGYQLR